VGPTSAFVVAVIVTEPPASGYDELAASEMEKPSPAAGNAGLAGAAAATPARHHTAMAAADSIPAIRATDLSA
jgi:hypothetical protein